MGGLDNRHSPTKRGVGYQTSGGISVGGLDNRHSPTKRGVGYQTSGGISVWGLDNRHSPTKRRVPDLYKCVRGGRGLDTHPQRELHCT